MPPVSSRTTMMSTPRSSSGFDRRRIEHGRVRHDGAQIGEQPERLAQLQQALFRTNLGIRVRPFGAADGAQQYRVGPLRASTWRAAEARRSRRWRRLPAALIRIRNDDRTAPPPPQRAHRLDSDFRTDAVAGEHCNACMRSAARRLETFDVAQLAA